MRKTLLGLMLIGMSLLLGGAQPPAMPSGTESLPVSVQTEPSALVFPGQKRVLNCLYYDRDLYAKGMAVKRQYPVNGELVAGMIPHHLLASDMIAGFFSAAAENGGDFDTVLIVSPSHFPENCASDVVTSMLDWSTPYGIQQTDTEITGLLLENSVLLAQNNPDAVEYDHGVAGLIPFVKKYLPDKKVAVCLLASTLSEQRLSELKTVTAGLLKEKKILLVASADCSHYRMPDDAAVKDLETAQAIERFDLDAIMQFQDDHVDSPESVAVFLNSVITDSNLVLTQFDHSSSREKLPHTLDNVIFNEGITTYFVYGAVRNTP